MADLLAGLTGGLDLGALTGGGDINIAGLDLGSVLGGLTGGSSAPKSNCAVGDDACQAAFDAKAAKEKWRKDEEEAEKWKEEYRNTPKSSTDLECSMDGFADMAIKLTENLLLIVSLLKETLAYAIPAEMSEAVELLWKGLVGSSSWLGYALYSLYGIGLDYNFAVEVCEAVGYGYYVIDGMNYIVAFAKPAEDGEGGASATDLLAAAGDALSGLGIDLPSEVTDAAAAAVDGLAGVETALQDGVDAAAAEGDAAATDSTTTDSTA